MGTVTAEGENNGINGFWEVATNAFDDTPGTKWLDFADNYPSTRQSWIQYQYANGLRCLVSEYTITSANDAATYPERNPADWRLLGSNNGGASWVTLDVRTNQVFTADFQKLAYSFSNTTAYDIYRFQIDRWPIQPRRWPCNWTNWSSCLFRRRIRTSGRSAMGPPPRTRIRSTLTLPTAPTLPGWWFQMAFDGDEYCHRLCRPSCSRLSQPATGLLALGWPAWAAAYTLYSTTNLAPPVLWSPATNAALSTNGAAITATLSATNNTRFFRLTTHTE